MTEPNASTRRWRALRAQQLEREPRCRLCRIAQATEVDHVIELSRGGARYEPSNLRSLCAACHAQRHGKRPPTPRPTIDADGLPMDHHWWCDP